MESENWRDERVTLKLIYEEILKILLRVTPQMYKKNYQKIQNSKWKCLALK